MTVGLKTAIAQLSKALNAKGAVDGLKKNPARRKVAAKKKPARKAPAKRKANPLKKWICFVGPQFPDTAKGKADCIAFAQKLANIHNEAVHVYKA